MKTIRTDRAREIFLTSLRSVPNVSAAARAAGFARNAAYMWKNDDPDFSKEWDEAVEESVDSLEQVAWERAKDQSDRMLEILLKAHRSEKYVDRQKIEHSMSLGAALDDLDASD